MTATSGSLTNVVDVALTYGGGLVAADRGVAQAASGEQLLGGVHDLDVLGEEHDLADAAGQLGGVVGGEPGLRLADPAHHAEDVLAARGLHVLALPRRDPADQLVVDAVDGPARGAGGERDLVALHQPAGELVLGGADRAAGLVVELDGEVGDPAGGDVGGDVDLAAPDDAAVDDGAPGGRVEARVGRRQAGLLERVDERAERLLLVDPAEELPDRLEVLDVVDQRRAGQRHQQRTAHPGADPVGEVQHVLRALRRLVLDEVRLVDDHAAQAVVAEPADVPVEDLVVHDEDVGEAVDVARRRRGSR